MAKLVSLFLFVPGMLAIYLIRVVFNLDLDRGQMWTFAIVLTVLLHVAISISNDVEFFDDEAQSFHIFLDIAIIAIFLIAKFGFKAEFPDMAWSYFF